jgi:hypothetical protein
MHISIPIEAPELDSVIVQLAAINARLQAIDERTRLMATQAQVDAIATAITSAVDAINTALAGIRSDIDALKAQAAVDVGPLEARVAEATAAVQALTDLDTENPPPA